MPSIEGESTPLGRKLFDATRPFAKESRGKSWLHVASTLLLLGIVLALAAAIPWWPVRLGVSVLGGLMFVRAFILYHDFIHGSLLHGSRIANAIFRVYGLIVLTPSRYWRYSHNFHHAHVGKPVTSEDSSFPLMTSDVGSFPLMTTHMWREASAWHRLRYRISRHALTLLCAYGTVFLFSICIVPLFKEPRKYWDGGLAILLHGGIIVTILVFAGFPALFFGFLLPFLIAAAMGAYLFYAQHNYAGMHIVAAEEWTYYRGATESSSYLKLGPILSWFTGNIGYHHVHHLNPIIPFYRLPEAMAGIPELQNPDVTTLRPRDILSCLKLNLWDEAKQRLVSYREAARAV